ncbi:MAG: DNA methyltransferase [Candidatus Helarchaeota archaeon]
MDFSDTAKKPSPLEELASIVYDNNPNLLLWGHDVTTIIRGLKFSDEDYKLPKEFQVIIVDLPYRADDRIEKSKRMNSIDPNNLPNLYIPIDLPSEVFFSGTIDDFFNEIRGLFKESWDLLNEHGFFVVKYIGRYRHYLKVLLDNVLGYNRFINEIFIQQPFYTKVKDDFSNNLTKEVFSCLFIYSKGENPTINPTYKDKKSGGYWHTMHSKGQGPPRIFRINGKEHKLSPPVGSHWKFKQETIDKKFAEGKIKLNQEGQPVYWVEEKQGHIVDNNWLDIEEAFSYDSLGWELNEKIFERIIRSFSNEGDKVLHIFSGNGTAAEVITRLNRLYTGIDPRMLSITLCKDFFIKNKISFICFAIGAYQTNQIEKNSKNSYIKFILNLLNGKEISNSLWFSGFFNNSLIHISPPNHTLTTNELESLIIEFEDFKHIFESIIVISSDFFEDEKWEQIIDNWNKQRKKIRFWKNTELWGKLNINGLFLNPPIVEISAQVKNKELSCSIEDFYFLNPEISNPKVDKSGSLLEKISHWTLEVLMDKEDIIFSKVYYRSPKNLTLQTSEKIKLNNNSLYIIKIEVFDICGAFYRHEKEFKL